MEVIFRPICWFLTLWNTLTNPRISSMLGQDKFVWFSGHDWYEFEVQPYPVGYGDLACHRCGLVDKVKR